MYKKYNLNELAESIQVLKEKNAKGNLGQEIGLLTLMTKIGYDLQDIKDLAEYCNLRLYDSKKYNEDFEYKSCIEKTQFKKYIKKKIEKLSGILERLEEKEPPGKWKKEEKKTHKNIKSKRSDFIPPRSDKKFSIAFRKLLNQSSIDVEMLSHLIDCEVFKVQGYLTGKYKNPSKEFIEEIADFFNVDPRYFLEYRKHLGKDYKEDRPITLVDYRITKKKREVFELPEQSDEEFRESFRKIMGTAGIGEKELASALHCSNTIFYFIRGDKKVKTIRLEKKVLMERIAKFFNICPDYFREYRENEIKDKLLADVIKYKGREKEKETKERILADKRRDKILADIIKHKRKEGERIRAEEQGEKNIKKVIRYYRDSPEKRKEANKRYREKNLEKARECNKKFREINPGYSKEYYKKNIERLRERKKIWYKNNRATVIEKAKEYYRTNTIAQ